MRMQCLASVVTCHWWLIHLDVSFRRSATVTGLMIVISMEEINKYKTIPSRN